MASAKDLVVKPIAPDDANRIVRTLHYSKKIVPNAQLHLGVFLNGKCGGAMQFGCSIDKRKTQGLVDGTLWNEFIELNRMAFADWLPRNSESRCLGFAMRWIRKTYPHMQWVISFADATQCGDGTIYRASGFVLTGIKVNKTILRLPDGTVVAAKTLDNHTTKNARFWKSRGAVPLNGFQLRYVFFLDSCARARLTVPILPFSRIAELGASMYRGEPRAGSAASGTTDFQSGRGGATPTPALQSSEEDRNGTA
jgi:hypothetical protein